MQPPEEPVTCYWLRQFRYKVVPELGYAQGTCNQLWLQLPLLLNYITKHMSPLTIDSGGPGDGVIYSANDHYAHFNSSGACEALPRSNEIMTRFFFGIQLHQFSCVMCVKDLVIHCFRSRDVITTPCIFLDYINKFVLKLILYKKTVALYIFYILFY